MPTAPTLAATAFVEGTAATQTTASISWQTGDVVLVVSGSEGGQADTWAAPTTTGSGLVFAAQKTVNGAAAACGAAAYAAVASASSSGTISMANPEASTLNHAVGVYVVRGSAGIGNSAAQAGSTTLTMPLTPAGADGLIVWGIFDWSATAISTVVPTPTSHSSASPGPSASPSAAVVTSKLSYYVEELDDQTSAGATSYGVASGTGKYTIIAVEAKAAAGAAVSDPAPLSWPGFMALGAPATVGLARPGFLAQPANPDGVVVVSALSTGADLAVSASSDAAGQVSDDSTQSVTVGLTAAGSTGLATGSASTITVGLTAAGGVSDASADAITVGLTAAGSTGLSTGASLTITTGRTSAGGATGAADSTVTVGRTAAGSTGLTTGAATTVTVGLTAAGGVADSSPDTITVGLTAAGVVTAPGGAPLTVTAGLTGTGAASGAAPLTVTVGLTAAGTVSTPGSSGSSGITVTAGLTAAGTVATSSGASLTITVGRAAARSAPSATDPRRVFRVPFDGRMFTVQVEGGQVAGGTVGVGFGSEMFGGDPFGAGTTRAMPASTRGWFVPFSRRSFAVQTDSRHFAVTFDSRTFAATTPGPTDPSRIFLVRFEGRVFAVTADGQPVGVTVTVTVGLGAEPFGTAPFGAGTSVTAPPTTRGWPVRLEGRSFAVQAESRTFTVPHDTRTLGA